MHKFRYRADDDLAFVEVPDDVVLESLVAKGIEVQVGHAERQLMFACPFCNPEQKAIGGQVQYCRPSKRWVFGRYVCNFCGEKTADQIAQLLDVPLQALAGKPLLIMNRSETAVQDAVEEALDRSGLVFLKGRQVVIVILEVGIARLERATVSELKLMLSNEARSVRYDQKKKGLVESTVPDKIFKDLMSRLSHPHLQKILRIVAHPLIDKTGEVRLDSVGYDKNTLLYLFFDSSEFESLRKVVTDEEAKAAYERLTKLLLEIGFVEDCDRAAGVLLLVTAVMNAALPATPLFLISSQAFGVGKTTLSLIAAALAAPTEPAVMSIKKDGDEMSRELLSMLAVKASDVLIIDNLNGSLPANPMLCSVITGTPISGRVVGSSEVTTTVARTLIIATGTGVTPYQDMIRRTISIWLRRPDAAFKSSDVVENVRAHRTEYVCDALKIVKWGRQKQLKPEVSLSSFADWGYYCLAPVKALSACEPLRRTLAAMNTLIPKKSANQFFLETLLQKFGSRVFTTKKVRIALTPMSPELLQIAIEMDVVSTAGALNARKLGWWLRSHVGERIGVSIHELTLKESSSPAKFFFRKI